MQSSVFILVYFIFWGYIFVVQLADYQHTYASSGYIFNYNLLKSPPNCIFTEN